MYISIYKEEVITDDHHLVFLPASGYGLNEWLISKGDHEIKFFIKGATYSGYQSNFRKLNAIRDSIRRNDINLDYATLTVFTDNETYVTAVQDFDFELDNFSFGSEMLGTINGNASLRTKNGFVRSGETQTLASGTYLIPQTVTFSSVPDTNSTFTLLLRNRDANRVYDITESGIIAFSQKTDSSPSAIRRPMKFNVVKSGTGMSATSTTELRTHEGANPTQGGYVYKRVPQDSDWHRLANLNDPSCSYSDQWLETEYGDDLSAGGYTRIDCFVKVRTSGKWSLKVGLDYSTPVGDKPAVIYGNEVHIPETDISVRYAGSVYYNAPNKGFLGYVPHLHARSISGSGVGYLELESMLFVGSVGESSNIIYLDEVSYGEDDVRYMNYRISENFTTYVPEVEAFLGSDPDNVNNKAARLSYTGSPVYRSRGESFSFMKYTTATISGLRLWNQWTSSGIFPNLELSVEREEIVDYPV